MENRMDFLKLIQIDFFKTFGNVKEVFKNKTRTHKQYIFMIKKTFSFVLLNITNNSVNVS